MKLVFQLNAFYFEKMHPINCFIWTKIGKLSQSDLDERAMDALKEFSTEDAVKVLQQFCESNLEHVGNKSAFLCGQMKTYRHKSKAGSVVPLVKGPDEAKLKVGCLWLLQVQQFIAWHISLYHIRYTTELQL